MGGDPDLLELLASLSGCDRAVLEAMREEPGSIAQLAARTGYGEAEVGASVARCEQAGLIRREPD